MPTLESSEDPRTQEKYSEQIAASIYVYGTTAIPSNAEKQLWTEETNLLLEIKCLDRPWAKRSSSRVKKI